MKIVKKIIPVVFWVLIAALLVMPLGLIVELSRAEQAEFATPEVPELKELAVGGVYQAQEVTFDEMVSVSGTFVSETYHYMPLDYETVSDARWYVTTGDEIHAGQAIGIVGETEILSDTNGIITQMHINPDDCYIKLRLFTPVELSCRVNSRTLGILSRSRNLKADGAAVTLTFASMKLNADGTTDVRLRIDTDKYHYGETATVAITTGRSFDGVISLPVRCVYQKSSGEQWYARQVSSDGIFLREVEVEIIYSDSWNVYVSGIHDGEYFDSGYQVIIGG